MLKVDCVGLLPINTCIGQGLWRAGSAKLDLMFGGMLRMLMLMGSFGTNVEI